jgi:FlaA1/EpsC-like NDP-sugar epimerase
VSWVLIDVALIIAAYVLAIAVRSINAALDFPEIYFAALAGVVVYLFANYIFGIYHRFWRCERTRIGRRLLSSPARLWF